MKGTIALCSVLIIMLNHDVAALDSEITKAMKIHEVIPDVIDEGPPEMLEITYDSGATADMGKELTPTQVQNIPILKWSAEKDAYYTVLLTEPDAPSREDLSLREWQHWLVVNIPEMDIKNGQELSSYQGSGPDLASGLHRYVYLVFKQESKMQFDELYSAADSIVGRSKFSTRKFMEKYNLGTPVAGNFYLAKYDSYSDIILAKLGLL